MNALRKPLMVACAGIVAAAVAVRPPQAGRNQIVPHADYHVHLLGPYALPLPDPLPPEIEVPEEIKKLLEARAALDGNVKGPADLKAVYTEDAQLLNSHIDPTTWYRDLAWFERYLNLNPKGRNRFAPNQFAWSGSTGFVAGTVVDTPSKTHVWNFLLALRKGDDGRWRIAADSTTWKTSARYTRPITADLLINELDEADIKKALVLSEAFWLGGPDAGKGGTRRLKEAPDEKTAVQSENDWTAAEVARYPDRLVFACAVDPLKDYAVGEIARCAKTLKARAVKMNLSGSGFGFDDAKQVATVAKAFRAANDNRIAVVIHLEPGRFYGPKEVDVFLDRIASAAPDVPIQIAHLAGNGPGITSPEALEAFAKARAAKDPRARNLYFDLGGLVYKNMPKSAADLMVARMRQIGMDRVLFGSDRQPTVAGNPPPFEQWRWVRQLPLTDGELRTLAANAPPYIR